MKSKLELKIITPDFLLKKNVDCINIKTTEGYVGIYPFHLPLIASLVISKMMYQENEKKNYLYIQGGLILTDGKKISIITDSFAESK